MFTSEQREPLFSFPSLPEWSKAGYAIGDLALRPFGYYESDMKVDFNQPLRPFLVTDILECCTRRTSGEEVPSDFFWRLHVGKRIECLLMLATADTDNEISSAFRCVNDECGLELEVELSAAEVVSQQNEAYETAHISVPLANRTVALRRPTANDQREWLKTEFANEASAFWGMTRTLLIGDPVEDAIEGATANEQVLTLESALEEHDPLVNFTLTVKCAWCETESLLEIDLEELSLQRLRQAQSRLFATVHTLAANYHWSEPQIFNVPYWRRARYLRLIEKGKHRGRDIFPNSRDTQESGSGVVVGQLLQRRRHLRINLTARLEGSRSRKLRSPACQNRPPSRPAMSVRRKLLRPR